MDIAAEKQSQPYSYQHRRRHGQARRTTPGKLLQDRKSICTKKGSPYWGAPSCDLRNYGWHVTAVIERLGALTTTKLKDPPEHPVHPGHSGPLLVSLHAL